MVKLFVPLSSRAGYGPVQKKSYSTHVVLFSDIELTPGPGAYNSEQIRAGILSKECNTPAITMSAHTKWPFKKEAPPPNAYGAHVVFGDRTSTVRGAPSWGMKGRFPYGSTTYLQMKAGNPGPATYSAHDPQLTKRSTQKYSLQGRTQLKNYNSAIHVPGPGTYNPQLPKKGGSSLGIRHSNYLTPLVTLHDIY